MHKLDFPRHSFYIATSVDGFIAEEDGNADWLHSSGNTDADMGFVEFFASVDCLIRGRNCMEMTSDLPEGVWPYGDTRIIVMSTTLNHPPASLDGKVEMYSADINDLVKQIENDGHEHAYIDGGKTFQSFLNLRLINEMTLPRVSILLGEGKALFCKTEQDINLEESQAKVFPNDSIQVKYKVNYL